jgi:hypothetical protein
MFESGKTVLSVVGIDIGKNSFHVVGLDRCGAIALRQKWSRGQIEARFANLAPLVLRKQTTASSRQCQLRANGL